ncbi:hypothetical protein [Sphingomonas rosea]
MKYLLSMTVLLAGLGGCATAPTSRTIAATDPLNAPELTRSFGIRDRYGIPRHVGGTAIYIDSVARHFDYAEASTIAWRDKHGRWEWSQVSERGPGGLLPAKQELNSNKVRSLTDLEAKSVEDLIRNPALYNGIVETDGSHGVGAPSHVMGIVTPFGRTVIRWNGRLLGPAGDLADILLGR